MYIVQVGYYAWLSSHNGACCVTTSGGHAARYHSEGAAQAAAWAFTGDRGAALGNSVGTPRLLAYLRSAPVTVLPAAELDARLARNSGDSSPRLTKPNPGTPVAEKPARGTGVTAAIRQWVLDHPQATKADALAAFPSANPSTVGVQFGAARKSVA